MAIRYDKNLNAKIYRDVHNFNQKVKRARKRGFTHLPPLMRVSELKARYETRADLNRELNLISKFNLDKDEALRVIETTGGARAIKWEYQYLKQNLEFAKKYYDREISRTRYLDTPMQVSKAEYINNLKAKRDYLELEMTEISQPQFNTFKATINEALSANSTLTGKYRGWLNEIEVIMRHLGYDNKTIKNFFKGFDQLTPQQFITMYRQNNLISRIYELYIPSSDGEFQLSTSEEDAKELINTVMTEKEEMIRKAKKNEEEMAKAEALEEWYKETQNFEEPTRNKPSKKFKRSELTEKQIKDLEALGWDDLIE